LSTEYRKHTAKEQRRERCVGFERVSEGLGTVIADETRYKSVK